MKKSFSFVLSMLCASAAFAEPPTPVQDAASALVNKQVVQPLKKADAKRSKFSRASPPPKARRVRVVDTVAVSDSHGKQFVRFAIDVKHRWSEDDEWQVDAFFGCVYVDEKKVYVQDGDGYAAAKSWLDGDGEVQAGLCEPAARDEAAPTAVSSRS